MVSHTPLQCFYLFFYIDFYDYICKFFELNTFKYEEWYMCVNDYG